MIVTVRNQEYDIRDAFAGKKGWMEFQEIIALLPQKQGETIDYDNMIRLFGLVVNRWPHAGAPQNPEAWEVIHAAEMALLLGEVVKIVSGEADDSKN